MIILVCNRVCVRETWSRVQSSVIELRDEENHTNESWSWRPSSCLIVVVYYNNKVSPELGPKLWHNVYMTTFFMLFSKQSIATYVFTLAGILCPFKSLYCQMWVFLLLVGSEFMSSLSGNSDLFWTFSSTATKVLQCQKPIKSNPHKTFIFKIILDTIEPVTSDKIVETLMYLRSLNFHLKHNRNIN